MGKIHHHRADVVGHFGITATSKDVAVPLVGGSGVDRYLGAALYQERSEDPLWQ
jgi:hypothetical protein